MNYYYKYLKYKYKYKNNNNNNNNNNLIGGNIKNISIYYGVYENLYNEDINILNELNELNEDLILIFIIINNEYDINNQLQKKKYILELIKNKNLDLLKKISIIMFNQSNNNNNNYQKISKKINDILNKKFIETKYNISLYFSNKDLYNLFKTYNKDKLLIGINNLYLKNIEKNNLNIIKMNDINNKIKILTFKKKISELNKDEHDRLFDLYKNLYNLNNLSCEDVIYFIKNDIIFSGLFINKIKYANMISFILHDNTNYGKEYIYDILNKLLNVKGYIYEVSTNNIFIDQYNLKPLKMNVVKQIFGDDNIISLNNQDNTYNDCYDKSKSSQENNYYIEKKQLFGKICNFYDDDNLQYEAISLNNNILNGCDLLIDDIVYNSYNIFENVFTGIATLTYISNNFVPYNNLDTQAIISNQVINKKVKINNIQDNNNFNIEKNGFVFVNLFDLDKNKYVLNDNIDRLNFRQSLQNFSYYLLKEHKQLFGNILPEYEAIVCLDAIPRDTDPNNKEVLFSSINLVHVDLYPYINIGDTMWSFRNTWYDKIKTTINDIEKDNLDKIENRNKWNNKVVGVFNFWISLTDGITDNGLAVLEFTKKSNNFLLPYKAFRTATKIEDNVNFISSSLKYNSSHNWYTKYNMKFGECFIFDTFNTPHTGFIYDNGSNKHRKSIELRIMLLKNINIKINPKSEFNISSIIPGDNNYYK